MIRQVVNTPPNGTAPPEYLAKIIDEEISPEELAASHARRERFKRNSAWLEVHGQEVYAQHRGRYICVAGGELFVADTGQEARDLAKAVHPEDDGLLSQFLSPLPGPRIYANQRRVASLH